MICNSGQQAEIKGKVDKVHEKLDEMYEWFLVNLKKPKGETNTRVSTAPKDAEKLTPLTIPKASFSLRRQEKPGDPVNNGTLICPNATFSQDLFAGETTNGLSSASSPFCCLCSESRRNEVLNLDHSERLQFTCKLSTCWLSNNLF